MSLLTCGIWDLSAPVSRCLCEHRACAFQLMTGNGGLPHSKTKHQEMLCRSDERQKMSGKMLNGRAWGEGWVYWVVIAHPTGNSCLGFEAGQKTCCSLGLDFCFACIFFALPCTYGARVSLTSGFARGSSFSCHLFAPHQALSQMTDFK